MKSPSKYITMAMLAMTAGFLLTTGHAFSASPEAPSEEDFNNGEDLTRPPARYDVRYQFQDKGNDVSQNSLILRRDQPIPLTADWKLSTRFDLPLVENDRTSRDNPDGLEHFGTGDALFQATAINTVTERFALAGGTRVLFPTATEDQFGSGKYRLLPIIGAREKLPWLSNGSFAELVARYDFDVGGYGGRSHVSQFQFSPTFNIGLPNRWFVTLFPSQDFVVNLLGGPKWFIPADFSIGRNLSKSAVISLEASVPIVKQYLLYDFKLEARLSFSF
jgi:hypothetical protein